LVGFAGPADFIEKVQASIRPRRPGCFLADRRMIHPASTIGPRIVCPTCGSDRLIPLTVVTVLTEDRIDLPRRPVAICAACGKRTYVSVNAQRALSPD
jgi:hypothetical protein